MRREHDGLKPVNILCSGCGGCPLLEIMRTRLSKKPRIPGGEYPQWEWMTRFLCALEHDAFDVLCAFQVVNALCRELHTSYVPRVIRVSRTPCLSIRICFPRKSSKDMIADLNEIKSVWDLLEKKVRVRQPLPTKEDNLKMALLEE